MPCLDRKTVSDSRKKKFIRTEYDQALTKSAARREGQSNKSCASESPFLLASSSVQTGILVLTMQADPPDTPSIFSIPGKLLERSSASSLNSSAFSRRAVATA